MNAETKRIDYGAENARMKREDLARVLASFRVTDLNEATRVPLPHGEESDWHLVLLLASLVDNAVGSLGLSLMRELEDDVVMLEKALEDSREDAWALDQAVVG